jgi:hypothetical protein
MEDRRQNRLRMPDMPATHVDLRVVSTDARAIAPEKCRWVLEACETPETAIRKSERSRAQCTLLRGVSVNEIQQKKHGCLRQIQSVSQSDT